MFIEDPSSGRRAGVDATNRLKTRGVTETGRVEAANDGNDYLITAGVSTLTSANESGIVYYENKEDFSLVITRAVAIARATTGGSTGWFLTSTTINPTGMTSGSGVDMALINTNFGSSNELDMTTSEIGVEGATVDGGSAGPTFVFDIEKTNTYDLSIILPPGASLGASITPPTGNTSFVVSLSFNAHKLPVV